MLTHCPYDSLRCHQEVALGTNADGGVGEYHDGCDRPRALWPSPTLPRADPATILQGVLRPCILPLNSFLMALLRATPRPIPQGISRKSAIILDKPTRAASCFHLSLRAEPRVLFVVARGSMPELDEAV